MTPAKSEYHAPGFSIEIEQPYETVRTMGHPYVDPEWSFTDDAGHKHGPALVLAHSVVLCTYWCDSCRDEHDETELRCVLCDQKIEPKYLWSGPTEDEIPGLMKGVLKKDQGNGYHFTYWLRASDIEVMRKASAKGDDGLRAWAESIDRDPDHIEMRYSRG